MVDSVRKTQETAQAVRADGAGPVDGHSVGRGAAHGTDHGDGRAPWTFACVTFGCKVNQYETEAVREAWQRAGGRDLGEPFGADLVLVNSCAVTGKAERDARNALVRLRRETPSSLLVLTGCATRLVADFVPRRDAPTPRAHSYVVPERKDRLCDSEVLAGLLDRLRAARADAADDLPAAAPAPDLEPAPWKKNDSRPWPALRTGDSHRARPVLKVQDGCSHRCTYCIVPLMRGPCVSRPPADVLEEAERLLEHHAEVVLSGINLGQYGRDNASFGDFWDLVARLDGELSQRYGGKRRLRVSSVEPSMLDERACAVLAGCSLVAPHLHISLQHASPSVLKRMGRGHYRAEMLLEACGRLEEAWPLMGLGADILVGFPGETPADVDLLCSFIEKAPFTYSHVFPYSRRPGTPAADFAGQVPRAEKLERAKVVRSVVETKARAFWEKRAACTGAALTGFERFDLCLDAAEGQRVEGHVHAVDAFYTPCFVAAEALKDALKDARKDYGERQADFVAARPVGLCRYGVLVEPLTGETATR